MFTLRHGTCRGRIVKGSKKTRRGLTLAERLQSGSDPKCRQRMKKPKIKIYVAVALIVGAIVYLVYGNFQDTMVYFYTPQEIHEKSDAIRHQSLRVGGLVKAHSLKQDKGKLNSAFVITDGGYDVRVSYTGLLPDLFQEGKGAIVEGKLGADNLFLATNVMVKHSEEYKPVPLKKKDALPDHAKFK